MATTHPQFKIEVITPEHEDYVEYGEEDFLKIDCQVCGSRGHKKLFVLWWDYYGADIIHCKDCLHFLREKIDALRVLIEFGI